MTRLHYLLDNQKELSWVTQNLLSRCTSTFEVRVWDWKSVQIARLRYPDSRPTATNAAKIRYLHRLYISPSKWHCVDFPVNRLGVKFPCPLFGNLIGMLTVPSFYCTNAQLALTTEVRLPRGESVFYATYFPYTFFLFRWSTSPEYIDSCNHNFLATLVWQASFRYAQWARKS